MGPEFSGGRSDDSGQSANNKLLEEIQKRKEEKARRIAEAKEAAIEAGKQPFDLEEYAAVYGLGGTQASEISPDVVQELEERYYIDAAHVNSVREFADWQTEMNATES